MRLYLIIMIALSATLVCCNKHNKDLKGRATVVLETNKGDIVLALYDETKLHRSNYLKLAKKKFFDGTLFHRVIDDFMIQGGDPDSKTAKKGDRLGEGGPGYDITAEIMPSIIHKKGVLAAAREGDIVNPKMKSSGSQFYIVKGKIFTTEELNEMEKSRNLEIKNTCLSNARQLYKNEYIKAIHKIQKSSDSTYFKKVDKAIYAAADSIFSTKKIFKFTKKQREVYTSIGGTPHLDGKYTVFGEVIEGQDIVDKIATVKTDSNNRPLDDIVIKKVIIIE